MDSGKRLNNTKRDLYSAVRTIDNIYRAWATVRGNVIASGQEKFKVEVKKISENPIPYLRRIQSQLQDESFRFIAQHGGLKKKSSGKVRPLVISPIANRVVQRAILNILQSENENLIVKLGKIPTALRTATSVGGIPKRGVAYGVNLIQEAIKSGATHYIRSDIRDFFTQVPKPQVIEFVRSQTQDEKLTALFRQALSTELDNAEEIKEYLYLFPTDDIGVPQGSSLSAFAGNVVLQDFDARMNGRNINTIRYIDDFVILGFSENAVKSAFESAQQILASIKMKAYGPQENPQKSKMGEIKDGFDFLGCSIKANGVSPSAKSKEKILADIRKSVGYVDYIMQKLGKEKTQRRAEDAYIQTLARIDRKIRGWGDAFSFCDVRLPFHQLDDEITKILDDFDAKAQRTFQGLTVDQKRRAKGLALLRDTPPLKEKLLSGKKI